jgi:hypothetical protein
MVMGYGTSGAGGLRGLFGVWGLRCIVLQLLSVVCWVSGLCALLAWDTCVLIGYRL